MYNLNCEYYINVYAYNIFHFTINYVPYNTNFTYMYKSLIYTYINIYSIIYSTYNILLCKNKYKYIYLSLNNLLLLY